MGEKLIECYICSGIPSKFYRIRIKKGGFFSRELIEVCICEWCGEGLEKLGFGNVSYIKEEALINNKDAVLKHHRVLEKELEYPFFKNKVEKCYICDKEVEKNEDTIYGNIYYTRDEYDDLKEEAILCDACKHVFFSLGDDFDWYEYPSLTRDSDKKLLTKQGIDFINSKGKSYFKNYAKNEALKLAEENALKNARFNDIEQKIVSLLQEKSKKMSISDIAAFLKEDREEVKWLLESLYEEKKIDFAGNGRYFIYSEEKKSSKKASTKKADPTTQIRKYAKLRDDGLITEEEYQAKKKEILGL